MAKRKKAPVANPKDSGTIVSMVRVVEVITKHGTFYRLVYLDTRDGAIVSCDFVNDYYAEPSEIVERASAIMNAMQLPILTMDSINRKH